jgi:hypothetical protein
LVKQLRQFKNVGNRQGGEGVKPNHVKYDVTPIAARTATTATMARALSNPLTVGCGTGRGAFGCDRGAAGRGAGAGVAGPAAAEEWIGAERPDEVGGGGNGAGADGPPGGKVGNLIVGAAEGFGGRLMRTVSFLGWIFEVSGLGGTAPPGTFGILSAISLTAKLKSGHAPVK